MLQEFELPVSYRGEERLFPAALQASRFNHQFLVDVYGLEILFEPDEERNYRAMIDPELLDKNRKIDAALLQAIAEAIEAVVK
jgi:hypothetical protein